MCHAPHVNLLKTNDDPLIYIYLYNVGLHLILIKNDFHAVYFCYRLLTIYIVGYYVRGSYLRA